MTFESALTFFLAIFVFGITPGPGVFAIVARALVKGASSCFMLALGMAISDILYLVAACFGLAVIATQMGELFTVIRIVGAAYLLYLGWKMWNAPISQGNDKNETTKSGQLLSFLQGFLISASNPKVILFYIAFLPTFMDISALKGGDMLLAAFLTLAGLMLSLLLIAAFASKARSWFQSESAMKKLNRSAGSIMFGAGIFLATRH